MTIEMILLGLLILIGLLTYSFMPLMVPSKNEDERKLNREHHVQDLANQLERLIESVQDLDFDYDTGKVTDEVYDHQRKMLVGRGVSVLMRLDQFEAPPDIDYLLEEQIAQRRAILRGDVSVDDVIEAQIAARREKAVS